jgi:hypothetical protein
MGVYFAGRPQSAEDQIWDHIDSMRDAGPVADSYLAAHERRAWAIETGRPATSGSGVTARACRRWIEMHVMTVGRWLVGTSPMQSVDGDRFLTTERRTAS